MSTLGIVLAVIVALLLLLLWMAIKIVKQYEQWCAGLDGLRGHASRDSAP